MRFLRNIRHHRIDEPDMVPLEIGDIVEVVDNDQVYGAYTAIAKKLRKIDQLHWVYKEFPDTDHKFKVIAIFDHLEEDIYDRGKYAVVIQDVKTTQVYITNELGVSFLRNATKSSFLLKAVTSFRKRFWH